MANLQRMFSKARQSFSKEDFDAQRFINFLYSTRAKLGLTQAEMAHKIGISSTSYQRIEAGNFIRINVRVVDGICKAFNLTPEQVIFSIKEDTKATSIARWLMTEESKPFVEQAYEKYLQMRRQEEFRVAREQAANPDLIKM